MFWAVPQIHGSHWVEPPEVNDALIVEVDLEDRRHFQTTICGGYWRIERAHCHQPFVLATHRVPCCVHGGRPLAFCCGRASYGPEQLTLATLFPAMALMPHITKGV